MKCKLVFGWVQIDSAIVFSPDRICSRPSAAFGAIVFDSEGLRRSPSMTIVRRPLLAISSASETAVVVFPSFGNDDVMPMERLARKSFATLIDRTASA